MSIAPEQERALPTESRLIKRSRFDLLRVPLLGAFLRWRWSRMVLQIPLLLIAVVMVAHAFFGPALAPKNLAALLTWVHYRGLVVIVLLVGGNFFCMACPFMLPREIARRFFDPRWAFPKWLRNKWLSVIAFVGVLFAYELFDLWGAPWWTGVLIVGYFLTAFLVDACFERASFCKFVCPIGQFNFLASAMSPLEVSVVDQQTCASCETKDCIGGQVASNAPSSTLAAEEVSLPIIQRGCELALFQPRKQGNLDCTFCLDCVYACPHDNVGIQTRMPGEELIDGTTRSGIGSLDQRSDWTALIVIFVFGALLNAFAMVSPVYALEQAISQATGLVVEWPILGTMFFVALVVEPIFLLGGAALVARNWSGQQATLQETINRFSRSLVPLGFGVWLAHYGFHFFTGALTFVPVFQLAIRDAFGWPAFGSPQWQLGGLSERFVYPLELGFLGLGLLGSLMVAWRIAESFAPHAVKRAFLPWGIVSVILFATACWILSQPMDMRGTFLGG